MGTPLILSCSRSCRYMPYLARSLPTRADAMSFGTYSCVSFGSFGRMRKKSASVDFAGSFRSSTPRPTESPNCLAVRQRDSMDAVKRLDSGLRFTAET